MLKYFCLIVAFSLVGRQFSKSKYTKMIHNIKLMLCEACISHAHLPSYLTINHSLECEE